MAEQVVTTFKIKEGKFAEARAVLEKTDAAAKAVGAATSWSFAGDEAANSFTVTAVFPSPEAFAKHREGIAAFVGELGALVDGA